VGSETPGGEEDSVVPMRKKKKTKKSAAAGGAKQVEEEEIARADSNAPSKMIEGQDDVPAVTKKTKKRKRSLSGEGTKEAGEDSLQEPQVKQGFTEADLEVMKNHKLFEKGKQAQQHRRQQQQPSADANEQTAVTPKLTRGERRKERNRKKREAKDLEHPTIDPLRLFVGGFPRCAPREEREKAVRARFEKFGELTEVDVPLDTKKQCMGMAFVSYTNPGAVAKAMSQSGTELLGVKIEVKPAFMRKKRRVEETTQEEVPAAEAEGEEGDSSEEDDE